MRSSEQMRKCSIGSTRNLSLRTVKKMRTRLLRTILRVTLLMPLELSPQSAEFPAPALHVTSPERVSEQSSTSSCQRLDFEKPEERCWKDELATRALTWLNFVPNYLKMSIMSLDPQRIQTQNSEQHLRTPVAQVGTKNTKGTAS